MGQVGGSDKVKVEFGASHVAMVFGVVGRQGDPLGGHWISATGLSPPHPLLSALTLKFSWSPHGALVCTSNIPLRLWAAVTTMAEYCMHAILQQFHS